MGVFSENVWAYYKTGLLVIPCDERKAPILGKNWEKYCKEMPDEEVIDQWHRDYKHVNHMGLVLGPSTGLCAFDFDMHFDESRVKGATEKEYNRDKSRIEEIIWKNIPQTPCRKRGLKGWTGIYKIPQRYLSDLSGLNVQADRWGVRCFDFLIYNKQTILPPSVYSDDIAYKWLDQSLLDCLDDIPEFEPEIAQELKKLFHDGKGFDSNTRHAKLFMEALNLLQVTADKDHFVDKLIDFDIRVNSPPYLSDKKHHPTGDARANALRWLPRIQNFKVMRSSGKGRDKGAPKQVSSNSWDVFFEKSFGEVRRDIISKTVMCRKNKVEPWIDIESLIEVLKAYALRNELPQNQVKPELARYVYEKVDMEYLCDLPDWDGVDRIKIFADCIHSPLFGHEEIRMILLQWGVNVFRRVEDSSNQNRCLVLMGDQKLGKDFLVRAMFSSFRPYYGGVSLTKDKKDALEIVSRLLIAHIEEFDQTGGIDVAFLKSLITQPSTFFRESYGRSPTEKITRPSFISTVNVDDFLRDPTGNRRFLIIPVAKIDWTYPLDQSPQVMAQLRHAHRVQKVVNLPNEVEVKIAGLLDRFTPEKVDDHILDLYREMSLPRIMTGGVKNYYTALEVAEVIHTISKLLTVSATKVRRVLCAAGYQRRTGGERRYLYSRQDALLDDKKNVL